jgi:transcriptional regulator with XRE-family HTH domain
VIFEMGLLEKIDRLMLLKGDNRNTLSKNTGIPYSTIANLYKLGYKNIKLSTLQKLADYFNVTLDFLVRDIEHPTFELTHHEKELVKLFYGEEHLNYMLEPAEQRLLNYYRSLNAEGQRVLMKNAAAYAQDPDYQAAPPRRFGLLIGGK